jgi:hypothetical protein
MSFVNQPLAITLIAVHGESEAHVVTIIRDSLLIYSRAARLCRSGVLLTRPEE